ncbi:MAG: bifunctional uroporphyrinogen-III C-methyltransferase/uroporphyrinogen-III synthase [Actinomycetota bacterium]|nr:bifunctional uroporphyrinogen-III C-methyltransferase/uroporphyrinogen-III synthase [Actinomycetota bacterium]
MTPTPTPTTPRAGKPVGRVSFVGAGPGDPGLVTLRARDRLAVADTVVMDVQHRLGRDDVVTRFARAEVIVVDAGHGEHGEELTRASRAKVLVRAAKALGGDGLIVRLLDGDPALFSGFAEEALALHKAGIPFEVVPGVSAATAVPMYAGVPLTSQHATAVHVVDAGERKHDWAPVVADHVTVVVLGVPEALRAALAGLLSAGRADTTPVLLTEQGTTTAQLTHVTTLGEVEALWSTTEVHFPSLAVVGQSVALRSELSWFESKPLFGWNILLPRTKDQAGATHERLSFYGARADVVPTISVEPPRTPQQMDRAIKGLVTGRYEWVGFTSVNAVRAVREKFEESGLDARAFSGLKIAAVGGVTAAALRDWGLVPDLVPSGEQSAAGLLADWPEYDDLLDPINRVFLPRADIATDTLVAGLVEMGWEVDDVTAYRTVRAAPPAAEVRDAIKSGAYDAVVFTSSSTVRNLVGIAGKPHPSTVVAVIGPATAKAAEEAGLTVDVMAPEASSDALVDALAAHGLGLAVAAQEAGEPVRRPSDTRSTARRRAR